MSSAAAAVAAQHDLKTAAEAFEAGFYLRAVSMLVSSESSSQPESRQYRHNLLISEYLSSKTPDPTLLMNNLATLDDASPDDVKDRAVLRYNRAILFVRCCQFVNALAVLWPIYIARVESGLELGLSVKIALLLLQIFIRTWNISRAESVLDDLMTMRQNLQSNDANCMPRHRSFQASDLSFYIHLFQTRISLLSRNEKTAKKTIKLAMQDLNKDSTSSTGPQRDAQETSDYHKASALLVKARLESFSDKYTKSIKLLNNVKFACSKDPRVSIVYMNNLGCVHYAMKRYHAAAFYFHRALELQEFDRSDRSAPYCIRFNWYLQQLNAGNADTCSNLFANVGLFSGSYWHWLQIGRASIQSYSELCYKDFMCSRPSSVFSQVPRFRLHSSDSDSSEISSFLQRGYSCFQNAFLLSPSTYIKQAALLGLSFICLALSRFSECLYWLDQFETFPISDKSFSIISKIYQCEALCSLNRMEEAMQCLSLVTNSTDSASEEDLASIYNSWSSLYCMYDKFELAVTYAMKSHSSQPNDERSLRNMLYLLLRHRMFAEAQFVLFHRLPPPAIALPE